MFKGSLAQGPLRATALQVSTTAVGQAIPITYGYDKTDGRIIYYSNFTTHGGNSGFFGSGSAPTTYNVDIDILTGFGPQEGVADCWSNGSWYYCYSDMYTITPGAVSAGQTVSFTVPSSSSANTNGAPIIMIAGVFLGNVPYSASFTDYVYPGQTNAIALSGNGIIPLNNSLFPAPNTLNYNNVGVHYASYNATYGAHGGSVTFASNLAGGFTINVMYYFDVHADQPIPLYAALPHVGWEASLGTGSSGNPLTYPEFSGFGGHQVYLNTSPIFPQTTLHLKGLFGLGYPTTQGTTAGWINNGTEQPIVQQWSSGDCNPADIIVDLITSGNDVNRYGSTACWNHGTGFNNQALDITGGADNLRQYSRYGGIIVDEGTGLGLNKIRNYAHAYTIYVSGTISDQTGCAQTIEELCEICNAAPVWDGATFDIIPYCEVSNFANGYSYTAPTSAGPDFAFTSAHFLTTKKEKGQSSPKPPVTQEGGLPTKDNYNSLTINFKDRTGQTNNNMVQISDAYDITRQGPMPMGTKSYNWIQIPDVATAVGWSLLRRNVTIERHGVYKFDLPAVWSMILNLMDLETITDPSLGNEAIPVRITAIDENEDFTLSIEAERFVYGACVPTSPGSSPVVTTGGGGTGGSAGGNNPSLSVNTPIIFEAVPGLATVPQLWFCVSAPFQVGAVVISVTLTAGGFNYGGTPTVSFTGGGGSGATAIAVTAPGSGRVVAVFITNRGSGYTSAPGVVFSGGGGTGAAATAVIGTVSIAYGGAVVNISTDGGSTYGPITGSVVTSTITGNQIMGSVTAATYPNHADPDAADVLNVNLAESVGTLPAFTAAQRDAFASVSYLAGGGTVAGPGGVTLTIPYELIAYSQSVIGGTYVWQSNQPPNSSTQIRRGVYKTPHTAHTAGTLFSYLGDGVVFKWNLPAALIGTTLYFKFQSFNGVGGSLQPLSSCTPYTFTPTGQVGFSQTSYTISPTPTVYQGQTSGWPGVDGSSTGWTTGTNVYFPPVTATFSNGTVLQYVARDSGLNVFTTPGQTAYVTIYDPGLVGESGTATLTAFADLNQTRWNSPGYIRIGTLMSGSLTVGHSTGGGGGNTTTGTTLVVAFGVSSGTTGTNVGPMIGSSYSGSITKCVVTVKSSDPTVALTFLIKQNGTNVFSTNPTVAAASAAGTVFTFTTLTTVPLPVTANDVFSIDITSGTASWIFSVQLVQ